MANRLHPLLETKPAMMTVLQNRYSFPEYPWSVSIKMSPERCLWLIPGQPGNNPWAETFNPVKKYLQKLALATNGIEIYSGTYRSKSAALTYPLLVLAQIEITFLDTQSRKVF